MIFDKLKAWGAIAAALALAVLLAVQTGRLHNAERAKDAAVTTLANERATAAMALAVATTRARETEQQMAVEAEKAEHEKQTQIAAVSARADALRKRLRNAEANAATARLMSGLAQPSATSEVAAVCHGSELSGQFGEQLVSEAERGDRVRLQLASCEVSYERARGALSR